MLKSPENLVPFATETQTQQRKHERERIDSPFWPAAMDVLQTRNTDALKRRVISIADSAPHVHVPSIYAVIGRLEEQYSGERKFTNEAEINHAYQVAILTAHAIGWRKLSLETFATALGHDYHENTPESPDDISQKSKPEVSRGIIALSHKNNGIDLYPEADDKRPYFEKIIEVHMDEPNLEIPTIKVMDQIAVANSPLRKNELSHGRFEQRWTALSEGKIKEMQLFQEILSEQAPQETRAQQRLREALAFTQLRMEPQEGANALAQVIFERATANGI